LPVVAGNALLAAATPRSVKGPVVARTVDELSSPQGLVALYADMDRSLRDVDYGPDTPAKITQLAVSSVPGVEQSSITEGRHGKFRTLTSTGEIALTGDMIQYDLDTGPCVDALLDETVFRTNDLVSDTRWPEFSARAHAETGVSSMMSLRLFMEGDDRTAGLNLYSTQLGAFDDDALIIATVLATHTAAVLVATAARERADNLARALVSNRRIGMAMGVLMSSHKLTDDDAFTLLRIASQNSNRKLTDIAEDVITTGLLELPPTASHPRAGGAARKPAPPAAGGDGVR
jgi:hypothetical protein